MSSGNFIISLTHKLVFIILLVSFVFINNNHVDSTSEFKSHLVKITTTNMIENDGNTPLSHYMIDCDEQNGHSRLSNIVAKLNNIPMPVTKTDDGKWWRVDFSSTPIAPHDSKPLLVTKVYTHLLLIPSNDVYLMPYSSIQYQARIIKQGRPQKIKIPSEQYYLIVEDRGLLDLDESTSTVTAFGTEGTTKISFVDKNLISDEDFIQPESVIHVVEPTYITLHVTPGDSWALQEFTDYTIEIKIFDSNQNEIYPSDNLDIKLVSSNEVVITNSTINGTRHSIQTLNAGASRLVARLNDPTSDHYSIESTRNIELIKNINIYEALKVKPKAVVLPWYPESSYQVSIYAAGGTGSYNWSSDNKALTYIEYSGDDSSIAKVTASGEGVAFIKISDTESPVFSEESMIVVAKIAELSFLPSIVETELNGDVLLPLAVYANASALPSLPENESEDSGYILFHDCSKIKFDVEIVEKSRFTYDPTEVIPNMSSKSCISLKFTCTQPGSSRVWVSYTDPSDPSSRQIKTTTIISCYKPLKPVYPAEVAVLALHTSIELAFEGGPREFGGKLDDHYADLETDNTELISFEPIIDRFRYNKDLHVFKVHCHAYGEQTMTLSVGNQPSSLLPNPANSRASMKIICAKPDSIKLRPRMKSTCPLNEMDSLTETIVPVSSTLPTDFEIIVLDDMQRRFVNVSSFSFNWFSNGNGTSDFRLIEEVNGAGGFAKITRNYVTLEPHGEGLGKIQVDLHYYKNQGLYRGQTFDLTTSLNIQFVDHATITQRKIIIYNHEKNIVLLNVVKGSGHFSVDSSTGTKHANVSYVPVLNRHNIFIAPLTNGIFSIGLEDQCISSVIVRPTDVNIVSDLEFSREAARPENTIKFCKDIDERMFCVYLSVGKTRQTTTRTPAPSTAPQRQISSLPQPPTVAPKPTTPAPVIDQTSQKTIAAKISPITFPSSTTPIPDAMHKLSFDDASSQNKMNEQGESSRNILRKIMNYLILSMITTTALTFGYKWWQNQNKRRPNPQFVTDSSFFRQTPSHHGSTVRFSPSPSTSRGPASSTPKTRPLFTERFSTTLFSD